MRVTDHRLESRSSLLRRRARVVKALPALEEVLRGSFLHRKIRCGKPGCRCSKGPGHELLCVTVSFAGGRTQQVTVPRELASTVKRWIENYRRYWRAIEEVSAINRRLLQLRWIPAPQAPRRGRTPKSPQGVVEASRSRRRREPQQ
jgi:hypothetical protein